ncbi:unnamed protein product [Orchesella dallaii]|uniref:Uncharacterized protein n=1 Tax=Orchesella dallaii TaxID=48710 RepID=A0ABP1RUJ8_9HEXA
MSELSEKEITKQREAQVQSLSNLEQSLEVSSVSDKVNKFLFELLKTLLDFCKSIQAKLGRTGDMDMDVNGNNQEARKEITTCFSAIRATFNGLFDSMESDVNEATESLNNTEQTAVANSMVTFKNVVESACELIKVLFKFFSKGLTWAWNKAKESFNEFIIHLEAIVSSNQKQAIRF